MRRMKFIVKKTADESKPKDFPKFKYEIDIYYRDDCGKSTLTLTHEEKEEFLTIIKDKENRFIHYRDKETVKLINIDSIESISIDKVEE